MADGLEDLRSATLPNHGGAVEHMGRYALLKLIAAGGMAEIHLARHAESPDFRKLLVIKRIHRHLSLDERFVNMFFDEARIAAGLNHPNIAQIFELGKVDGRPFLAMEYIEGVSLGELYQLILKANKPLPWSLVAWIGARAAEGLDHAHNMTDATGELALLVHRDVSPQNILVSFDGAVKVVDFGIAKATVRIEQTQSYSRKGKLRYMSPEQALGLPLDRRSDIFSLAVVLWELVSSARLFDGEGELAVMRQITEQAALDPTPAAGPLPDAFVAILRKALEKEPEDRFASAAAMAEGLDGCVHDAEGHVGARTLGTFMTSVCGDQSQRVRHTTTELLAMDVTYAGQSTPTPNHPPQYTFRKKLPSVLLGMGLAVVVALVFLMRGGFHIQAQSQGMEDLGSQSTSVTPAPPQAPAVVVAMGGLRITSKPAGVLVLVDGEYVSGKTPLVLYDQKVGSHRLTFEKQGYKRVSQRVTVHANKVTDVHQRLRALPVPVGYLTLGTVPWSVVYLGKKKLGDTTPLLKQVLPEGVHELQLLPMGKNPGKRITVKISAGKLTTKNIRL